MTAPLQFFHLSGQVLMRMGNALVVLGDELQAEILDDLKALSDAARAAGARDLRVETMRRAYQLQYARIVSKLPAKPERSAA